MSTPRHGHPWFIPTPLVAMGLALGACEGGAPTGPRGELTVTVAGLTLPTVEDYCIDLRATNGTQVVWRKGDPLFTLLGADQTGAGGPSGEPDTDTVCASKYGSTAAGAITYSGTCDASSDSSPADGVQNDVTVWLDGFYANGVEVPGWQDPCPDGCTVTIDCNEEATTLASFDLIVMSDAMQGFFDIAVSFSDIFCSAKLDTCYPDGADLDTAPDPIRLLHGDGLERDWTAVMAFACTAGPDAGSTELLVGPLEVVCGAKTFTLDAAAPVGNASVSAGADTLHYGVYRGAEALTCDGAPCQKVYWNVALSLDDLAAAGGTCTLAASMTAHDPDDASRPFVGGVPTSPGLSYPYLAVDATLTTDGVASCQSNRLDGDGSAVTTSYAGSAAGLPAPPVMCTAFDGAAVTPTGGDGCPGTDPVVGAVSPVSAGAGDPVTFSGSGFGSTPGTVTFSGGATATVTSWTSTAITVTAPAGGISGPVTITRADGTTVADAPYFAYDDVAPPPIATLNATAYSIFDLDFDGLGNAYYAEFISGVDRMHRVAPDGTKTSYTGISDYNLGFGAASWDGSIVSGAYSGTTPRGVLLVNASLVMEYLHPVTHMTCSSWAIDGYNLCGPMDPEWGFDGWFYVGNLSGSGDVSRYNLTTTEVIVTLPAFVVSVATTSDQRLWAAAGNTLYAIDRVAKTFAPVATFASDIVSISASQLHQRIYVERVGGVIESVTYGGAATTFQSGFTRPAFITVGPDFRLYRIEGRVNAYSTITAYTLPAP